jgi:hypothetical protein
MPVLHMQTEAALQVAERLTSMLADVRENANALRDVISNLDWQASGRDSFVDDASAVLGNLNFLMKEGEEFVRRLRNEVLEWERTGAGVSGDSPSVTMSDTSWIASLGIGVIGSALFGVGTSALDIIGSFITGRLEFKDTLRNIGRRSGQRGAVKTMDQLYGFLSKQIPYQRSWLDKSFRWFDKKLFGEGFAILGGVAETYVDFRDNKYGGDAAEIVGTNAVNTGINIGIGLTPPGRVALLISSGVQIVGGLKIAVDQTIADVLPIDNSARQYLSDLVQLEQKAWERVDLNEMTKSFSNVIYEDFADSYAAGSDINKAYFNAFQSVVNNPSWDTANTSFGEALTVQLEKQNDLTFLGPDTALKAVGNTARAAGNVLDGALDAVYLHVAYGKATTKSLSYQVGSTVLNTLPVPDEWKRNYADAFKLELQTNMQTTKQFVNWVDLSE